MANAHLFYIRRIVFTLVYTAIFPIANLIGGSAIGFGIVPFIPFLPLAWAGGMAAVQFLDTENAYLLGASISIFFQCIFVQFVWSTLRSAETKT